MRGRTFSRRSDWLRRMGPRQDFAAVYGLPLAQDPWNGHAVRDRGAGVGDAMDTPGRGLLVHRLLPDPDGVQRAVSPRGIHLFPELLARDIVGRGTLSRPVLVSGGPLFRCRPSECPFGPCSCRARRRVPRHRPGLDNILSAKAVRQMGARAQSTGRAICIVRCKNSVRGCRTTSGRWNTIKWLSSKTLSSL